ncbi:MAG: ABC-2 transporter permease [Lachnospiraceae bacterium]|nr:ABC-2 transporter permease [Lachnospiraceae bacterium]MBO5144986.1 ABC-2 transporter permease [Lachnospiraceae bacterium]
MNRSIKGLLIKDLNLMKGQKTFFIVIILACVLLFPAYSGSFFTVGYVTIICAFFTLSTLSYDEYENGASYLFTLPITRRDYAREKYLFGFLMSTVPCILATAASYLVTAVKGTETDIVSVLAGSVGTLLAAYLLLALEIPLQLKFGQAKSRMMVFVSAGGIACMILLLGYLKDITGIEDLVLIRFLSFGKGAAAIIGAAVFVILMWISYQISCRIVEKKEF